MRQLTDLERRKRKSEEIADRDRDEAGKKTEKDGERQETMAKRIARFYKVSLKQFAEGCGDLGLEEKEVERIYREIALPRRATSGSAGYDFFTPIPVVLKPGQTAKIPTGIRVEMEEDWVLKCYPRSGLGFRYRLQLNNTVGIIDSDYFYSDNEGHIFAKITNDTNEEKCLELKAGDGFMQGVFVEYGITVDDRADGVRNGGFGSTSKESEKTFTET